jgi:hypothetical protein
MADDEFIGRERECAQLASPTAEALRGYGSLILVAGEAGVGKTTLVREALSGSGLAVVEGFPTPGGASAFAPLVEVLRAHLRSTASRPLIGGPFVDHLALLLPELGPATREGDPATLFEAIRLALATIAARQPTAIFLDDLQWADDVDDAHQASQVGSTTVSQRPRRSCGDRPALVARSGARPGTRARSACWKLLGPAGAMEADRRAPLRGLPAPVGYDVFR